MSWYVTLLICIGKLKQIFPSHCHLVKKRLCSAHINKLNRCKEIPWKLCLFPSTSSKAYSLPAIRWQCGGESGLTYQCLVKVSHNKKTTRLHKALTNDKTYLEITEIKMTTSHAYLYFRSGRIPKVYTFKLYVSCCGFGFDSFCWTAVYVSLLQWFMLFTC